MSTHSKIFTSLQIRSRKGIFHFVGYFYFILFTLKMYLRNIFEFWKHDLDGNMENSNLFRKRTEQNLSR